MPWMEKSGGLQSMGSLRVGHDWATSLSLFTFMHWRRKWRPTPVFLPGQSQGWGEPGGLPTMGSHRVGHDWSDLAAAAGQLGSDNTSADQDLAIMSFLWGLPLLRRAEWSDVFQNVFFSLPAAGSKKGFFLHYVLGIWVSFWGDSWNIVRPPSHLVHPGV